MSNPNGLTVRKARFLNRVYARFVTRKGTVTGFVSSPEPRTIGSVARGRQLIAGNFLFAGYLINAPDASIWALKAPNTAFEGDLHGFVWMEDLAAVGDTSARAKMQSWLWEWIDQFGRGSGAGWTPDLTGRRLIRWINHAVFVLRSQDSNRSDAFYLSLAQQTIFLSKRWHSASPGLPRFEALTGLIYACFSLQGMESLAKPAIKALAEECSVQIDREGGLPARNPEELLAVYTLLIWAATLLEEAGLEVPAEHQGAIERITPTLRTLRHSDGGLARFHGGGRGQEGWLDYALAAAGIKTRQPDGISMGFARLSAGRTSVIIDAAVPPLGSAARSGHASTLAFELTSGRRPLVVNCGSGASFGVAWRRAGRATPSHSTVVLDGYSSARLGDAGRSTSQEALVDAPKRVPIEVSQAPEGLRFQGGHDGFCDIHGLTHARTLELTFDGRGLAGEDMLLAIEDGQRRQFDRSMNNACPGGVPFDVRFHLHPEVDATLDLGRAEVLIALKSGEIWVFRHDGKFNLALEPSVYLQSGRLKPCASQQVVLSGRAVEYATRIRWSLSKAQETAIGVRDLNPDEYVPAN